MDFINSIFVRFFGSISLIYVTDVYADQSPLFVHYFHNGLQPSLLSNKHIYYRGIIRSALLSKYCMLKNPRDPTEYTDNNVYYFRFTFAVDVSTSR